MSSSNLEKNPGILCSEGCFLVHQLLCEQCLCNTKPILARCGSTPIPLNISCGDGFAFLRNAEKAASFLLQEDQRTPLPQYRPMYIIFTFPRYVSCRSFSASICNSLQLFFVFLQPCVSFKPLLWLPLPCRCFYFLYQLVPRWYLAPLLQHTYRTQPCITIHRHKLIRQTQHNTRTHIQAQFL